MSLDLGFVWADRSKRERLAISGLDRARFLHNLCTNDVKRLASRRGCEAFVTSPQGRTLGLITILAREESLLVLADPDGLELVRPHLERYGIFDEVELGDQRSSTFELHVAGDDAAGWLRMRDYSLPVECELDHDSTSLSGGSSVEVVRQAALGLPGYTLIGPIEIKGRIVAALEEMAPPLSTDAEEGLRIEAGIPRFGRDFNAENLPQEVGRDLQAISFTKGCYLGQETVARLDALGHVNKLLRGVKVQTGRPPVVGAPITVASQPAGIVTSSGRSPRDGRDVALAMVRVKVAPVGSLVAWDGGEGMVVDRTAS